MDNKIITRQEAQEQGLKLYLTGKPCKHGHISPRRTNNTHCRQCRIITDNEPTRLAKNRAITKRWCSILHGKRYIRNNQLLRDFGISHDEYDKMLTNQNNVCAICKNPEPENKALAVDHCHSTKKVRGILCSHCNIGLGKFRDNIEFLQSAIDYLKDKS